MTLQLQLSAFELQIASRLDWPSADALARRWEKAGYEVDLEPLSDGFCVFAIRR